MVTDQRGLHLDAERCAIARTPRNTPEWVRQLLLPLLLALAYAAVLACQPLEVFKDRDNYLIYASASEHILANYAQRGAALYTNEPLWLAINTVLANLISPEWTIRFIIFFPAFATSFVILRIDLRHTFWLLLFLVMPQVIKNNIVHLRQGVAVGIFLLAFQCKSMRFRVPLLLSTPFIHASFFPVLLIGLICYVVRLFRIQTTPFLIALAAVYTIINLNIINVAAAIGARQGDQYMQRDLSVSGLGFVFWLSVLFLMCSSGKKFVVMNLFPVSVLLFYLCGYFLVEVSGRIFESVILVVLVAGLRLSGWRQTIFLSAVVFYTVISYILRIDQPFLGWGASATI